MPYVDVDSVKIFYEETGAGRPLIFLHEYLGDCRSWDDQVRAFSRDYRCIVISARGYPPSDAPEDETSYGVEIAKNDVLSVMDHLNIDQAHLVGLSMGSYTTLYLTLTHSERVLSAVVASGGSGAFKSTRQAFIDEALALASQMDETGTVPAEAMGLGPARLQLERKDPKGWATFVSNLAEHSPKAAAITLRQIQTKRPSLFDQESELAAIETPVLLMVGDEDEACLDTNLYLKRTMPSADLVMFPGSGHTINLEEPALFALFVGRFLSAVDRGTWRPRDPQARPKTGAVTALSFGDQPSEP